VSSDGWAWLRKVYDEKWETLARAKAAGVKIAAGTDAGFVVAHGDRRTHGWRVVVAESCGSRSNRCL